MKLRAVLLSREVEREREREKEKGREDSMEVYRAVVGR